MNKIIIVENLDCLKEVSLLHFHNHYRGIEGYKQKSIDFILEKSKNPLWKCWLAMQDKPAGYCTASFHNDEIFTEDIYVIEEKRRNRIGKALLSAEIDFARNRGIKEIYSWIIMENHPSIKLHESLGFVRANNQGSYLARLII